MNELDTTVLSSFFVFMKKINILFLLTKRNICFFEQNKYFYI